VKNRGFLRKARLPFAARSVIRGLGIGQKAKPEGQRSWRDGPKVRPRGSPRHKGKEGSEMASLSIVKPGEAATGPKNMMLQLLIWSDCDQMYNAVIGTLEDMDFADWDVTRYEINSNSLEVYLKSKY